MKILFIGAATSNHTIRWVNALVENGHDVLLVSRSDQRDNVGHISKQVKIIYLKYCGGIGYYLNVPQLKRIYKEYSPDVVNAHYATGYGTLARLAKCKPLVISVWGSDVYDFPFKSNKNRRLICKNLNYCDAIASTSFAMAEQTKKILNNFNKNITVTPFGVDINKFKKTNYTKNDIFTIGIVKYLEPIYDIPLLINAFYIVQKQVNIKLQLSIYGDGSLKDELVLLCEKLNISDKVIFNGTIPNYDIPAALQKFDIFVNCSKQESFGVAIVEAMACELPIVATPCEGFKEVVVDGVTGIILEDRKPETMANKLIELINDEEKRYTYGKNARTRVEEFYDWHKNVYTMIDLYEKVS